MSKIKYSIVFATARGETHCTEIYVHSETYAGSGDYGFYACDMGEGLNIPANTPTLGCSKTYKRVSTAIYMLFADHGYTIRHQLEMAV